VPAFSLPSTSVDHVSGRPASIGSFTASLAEAQSRKGREEEGENLESGTPVQADC
jgi:hypothetical protein